MIHLYGERSDREFLEMLDNFYSYAGPVYINGTLHFRDHGELIKCDDCEGYAEFMDRAIYTKNGSTCKTCDLYCYMDTDDIDPFIVRFDIELFLNQYHFELVFYIASDANLFYTFVTSGLFKSVMRFLGEENLVKLAGEF